MKRLLIFLLLSLFLGTSLCTQAGERATTVSIKKVGITCGAEDPVDYSKLNSSEEFVSPGNIKRIHTTPFQSLTYSNFIDLLLLTLLSRRSPEPEHLYKAYLYSKPISLKLIFPEHYFW